MKKALVLQAPAKVNLYLKVLNKRPDGYHNLSSLMQMVGLYDRLTFEEAPEGIHLHVEQAVLPSDRSNLVFRAAERLQREAQEAGHSPKGVIITLAKNIPIAAGLGGGSSDAAAALIGLNRLWLLDWPRKRLAELGAEIGSDLPFFFYGPSAWVSGRGEVVDPIEPPFKGWTVLVHPKTGVSTASVYEAFSKKGGLTKGGAPPKITPSIVERPSIGAVLRHPSNDLEEVTLLNFPHLERVKALLVKEGGEGALMSGSGPTLFALFKNHQNAKTAAKRVARYFGYRVTVVQVLQRSPV